MERMTPDTIDFNSLSKKQLVELVIAKYNDCFRLEEENENLNIIIENTKIEQEADRKHIEELEEENKKLKKYYDRDKEELMESCYGLARENDELKKDVDYRHHRAMVAERGGEDED